MLAVWRGLGGAHHKGLFSVCRHLHDCVRAAGIAWRGVDVFSPVTPWFFRRGKSRLSEGADGSSTSQKGRNAATGQ